MHHYRPHIILALVFISHLFGLITVANANMQTLHGMSKNADLAPICNGTGSIKWISLSAYYQTGELVFVEQNETPSTQTQPLPCSLCTLLNPLDDDVELLVNITHLAITIKYPTPKSSINFQRFGTTSKANARAPPATC